MNESGRVRCEKSVAYQTTSSAAMEVEAVTAALIWLSGTSLTHPSILGKVLKGCLLYEML